LGQRESFRRSSVVERGGRLWAARKQVNNQTLKSINARIIVKMRKEKEALITYHQAILWEGNEGKRKSGSRRDNLGPKSMV